MGPEWEYPDIEGWLEKDIEDGLSDVPDPGEFPIGQGYIIDPDYMEILRIDDFDNLIRK